MTSLLWVFFPYYPSLPEIGVEEAGFHDILTPKFGDGFGGQQAPSFGSTSSSTSSSSTTPGSGSTGREDDHIPFGPIPIFSTLLPILLVCNLLGCLFGFFFTRHRPPRRKYGRTDLELWYIVAHNSIVVLGSALAWLTQSTFLALATFSFEISYEVFDSWAVYSRFGKIDHETLMHHVGAPLCILFATQTRIDMRVLCHLSICIDLSGAVLAFFKLMMRAGRHSIRRLYRALFFVYFPLRIVYGVEEDRLSQEHLRVERNKGLHHVPKEDRPFLRHMHGNARSFHRSGKSTILDTVLLYGIYEHKRTEFVFLCRNMEKSLRKYLDRK
ncbi:unnamed protein product [Amoebophrya sp. A25]|nr:unnamed protein product [Amoebophrya sp. A25]|eukprot:GSA25T00015403001.1